MAIRFNCPHCKTNYEVADDLAGKMIMCRGCQKRGQVGGAAVGSATLLLAGESSSWMKQRRLFLIGFGLASLAAVGGGALLARRPRYTPPTEGERQRFRRRPPDDGKPRDDKKNDAKRPRV